MSLLQASAARAPALLGRDPKKHAPDVIRG
jgi:hypothetical protein